MIEEYFKIAFKNLNKRKMRSFLTIVGIFLGIFTIFVLLSLSFGLKTFIDEQFEMLGSDKFFIQPKGQLSIPGAFSGELDESDLRVVKKINGVDVATYMDIEPVKIEFEGGTRYYYAIGIPTDDKEEIDLIFESAGIGAEKGRMLKKRNKKKALLGYNYGHKKLFKKYVKVGDIILLNNIEFEVVGILESVGNPGDDQNVYITIEDFKELFNSGDRVDYIYVKVKDEEKLKKTSDEVERKLMRHRNVDEKTKDFTILTPEELLETFGNVLNIITAFLVIIALISALIGGIGIVNTMYTSVLERKKEIGTMKALGARNSDILLIFVAEAGILGIIGGLAGVILGAGVAKTIEYLVKVYVGSNLLRASFHPLLILGCLSFGFIIGIISGLIPSYQASRLKPVDTLRYE